MDQLLCVLFTTVEDTGSQLRKWEEGINWCISKVRENEDP